ncbi:hypothetical protein JCM3770_002002 [Rhodotorula araucariae]
MGSDLHLASPRLSSETDAQPAFFFVKALHSFSSQQATSCLSFSAGQIIKCYNRDASGWWDGECEGRRGWFPSNYTAIVEEDANTSSHALSPDATTLLGSIDHNVRLLENAVQARRKSHYQPSTACVISSIRTVLSATSALTRDSPVLRQHPSLASSRKRILSSLAALVNQARKASAPGPPSPPPGQEEADAREADEMLRIARETLDSVRAFLRAAEERGVRVDLALGTAAPVGAGVKSPGAAGREDARPAQTQALGTSPLRPALSPGNLRSQRRSTLVALHEPIASSTFPLHGPMSVSSSPTPPTLATTPSPVAGAAQLTLRSTSALSLHFSTLHDSLLSTIAALIGHVHSHARSSSPASSFAHLIDLTREGIERVRDVLVVVERVAARVLAEGNVAHDGDEMKVLTATREKLYEATTALVAAARVATSPSPRAPLHASSRPRKRSTDSSASVELGREQKRAEREQDDDERKTLLGAATSVLRAGGDCVGAVKLVVQRIAGTGARLELTLPRPKTVEELAAMEQAAEEEEGATSRAADAQADAGDSSSTRGSLKFADASEEIPSSPTASSVSAAAEKRAIPRPGFNGDSSPRKRNLHTLSMLGRKASSLGSLRGRYEADDDAGAMGGLTLEEGVEGDEREDDGSEEDRESACTGDSEQTASSPALPRRSSFSRSVSSSNGYSQSIKRSSLSLSPAYRAGSPASSGSPTSDQPRRPSSSTMHREQSNESAHSASSSRATAMSVASSSAVTTHTAETSPRTSMQNAAASIAAAMLKTAPRSSLGSVLEAPLVQPLASPNATPRGSVSAASSSGGAWFLQRDYLPREISFNADGHVSGGTLRCLVERMTLHDTTIDAAFSNTFLLTFRMFTTPLELADLLWARFDLAPPRHPDTGAELAVDEMKTWTAQKLTPIRLRIYNLLKTWVESFWLHAHDREIVDSLLEWCSGRLKAAMPSASTRLADLVQKRVTAAQQEQAQAQRDSTDEFGVRHNNLSSPSLASGSSSPSLNGSSLSLSTSNTTTPASSIRNGLTGGGLLHRMQSADKLKAGKTLVPFSSLSSGSTGAQDAYSPTSAAAASAPPPLITKSLVAALRPALSGRTPLLANVTELDPLELARQLTIMESRVYCAIRADELLGAGNGAAGGSGDKAGGSGADVAKVAEAPNVRKMSALSTRLTGWITETILGEQEQKRRTSLLKFYIKLGDRLLALANYNALFAVFTALNSSTVTRLRKTWDGLAPKYRTIFETLRKATDHGRNYSEYRQKIRQAVPPCLPFVGLFLTDLIFVFEGNRAERPSPADPSLLLINFDRYHKMARIVGELQRFQSPYTLVEVPEMQAYLSQELEGLKRGQDAQTLYRQSLMIEPRQNSGPSSSAASFVSSHDSHRPRDIFNWRG